MADDAPAISMNSSWRTFFAATSLAFAAYMILWLVVSGNPANSLHQSALSWFFVLYGGILAALGVPSVATLAISLLKK